MNYYNEIQRLNSVLSDQNTELHNLKSSNQNLNEQYENLSREFQLEQKMVEDLNQQIFELNNSILTTTNAFRQQTPDRTEILNTSTLSIICKVETETQTELNTEFEKEKIEIGENKGTKLTNDDLIQLEEKYKSEVEKQEQRIEALQRDKEELIEENRRTSVEMSVRLEQTQLYYEDLFKKENENFRGVLANEEQQKAKLARELDRLKEHLMTMSENYNNEAIQAENREKQLRTALSEAQTTLQQQGTCLETSNKEMEVRVAQLLKQNQDLIDLKENLKDKLKQAEESLNHQMKVTKNIELVLERVQNGITN